MIDTNTVSYIVKGRSPAARIRLAGLHSNEVACISAITEGELLYGLAKHPKASTLRPLLNAFVTKIQVLAWGRDEAAAYGTFRAQQETAGKTLGSLDLLIASHAISAGAVLVTSDKAFGHIQDLPAIVNWADDLT